VTAALVAPRGLIEATEPAEYRGIARDAVRLLVTDRASRTHAHARFFELPSFLRAGDLLVVNDSATVPAAIVATRANGQQIPLHVATMIDQQLWTAEPRGLVVVGEELRLPNGGSAVPIAPIDPDRPRLWYVRFELPVPMQQYLAQAGEPIRYGYVTKRIPLSEYQTIFAREPGSAEMPSAARPFTSRVLAALRRRGVGNATITLHCGVSSFESPERPSFERFAVPYETVEAIDRARQRGRRVIAVGTTVLRALESAVRNDRVVAASGWTDLVIDEAYTVRSVDGMLTGFHDPAATHRWMLQSLLDRELLDAAYDAAAERNYHYHEFGDAHLIV